MAESLAADAGAGLKALGVNCTLKKSPETSNTEALMNRVLWILEEHGVETEMVIYPDEGHPNKLLPHREDVLRRVLDWFDKHQ